MEVVILLFGLFKNRYLDRLLQCLTIGFSQRAWLRRWGRSVAFSLMFREALTNGENGVDDHSIDSLGDLELFGVLAQIEKPRVGSIETLP
jgi:hypothetical protein